MLVVSVCVWACVAAWAVGAASAPALIIDTDTAMLLPDGLDCDDDLHLLFILSCQAGLGNRSRPLPARPHALGCGRAWELAGITNTYVNSFVEHTHKDTTELLDLVFGPSDTGAPTMATLPRPPAFEGAGVAQRDLHRRNAATDFLLAEVARRPARSTTVVGIGSLANLGAAVEQGGAAFLDRLGGVVLLGGSLYHTPVADISDVNFEAFPEATNAVLRGARNVTIVPVELAVQGAFSQEHYDWLNHTCPGSIAFARGQAKLRLYLDTRVHRLNDWFQDYPNYDPNGFIPWDTYVALYATHPELFATTATDGSGPECCEMRRDDALLWGLHCDNASACAASHRRPNAVRLTRLLNRTAFFDTLLTQLCRLPL